MVLRASQLGFSHKGHQSHLVKYLMRLDYILEMVEKYMLDVIVSFQLILAHLQQLYVFMEPEEAVVLIFSERQGSRQKDFAY